MTLLRESALFASGTCPKSVHAGFETVRDECVGQFDRQSKEMGVIVIRAELFSFGEPISIHIGIVMEEKKNTSRTIHGLSGNVLRLMGRLGCSDDLNARFQKNHKQILHLPKIENVLFCQKDMPSVR